MNNTSTSTLQKIEKLVIDTHILIWYLEGIELSQQQVQIIENQRNLSQLYISAISIWEVSMLINKKKAAISKANRGNTNLLSQIMVDAVKNSESMASFNRAVDAGDSLAIEFKRLLAM